MGTPDETMAIVVRGLESADAADWEMVYKFLGRRKMSGMSLVLVGESLPKTDLVAKLRTKVARSGVYVNTESPTGPQSRADLVHWIAEDWKVPMLVAQHACERANYEVGALAWATHAYKSLSSGLVMSAVNAQRIVEIAVPVALVDDVYRLTLAKDPRAYALCQDFRPWDALALFRLLESALRDLTLLRPVLSTERSIAVLAKKTGLHPFRVADLRPFVSRYPAPTVLQCRQALTLGFRYYRQPEAAQVVVASWA